jgi:GNAT superfamily N-acetyltransferase
MSLYLLPATEQSALVAALAGADLPVVDLDRPGRRFFRWEDDAAFGGLEGDGHDVLLRSVVVAERGTGIGTRLVQALAEQARRDGALRLWLLTTSAEAFFARRGFHRIDRAEAPAAIQATAEFRGLCPASAVLMMRALHPTA